MQDLLFFLGRFHVLALHLPIGMLILAVALDWFSRVRKDDRLASALPFVWAVTAICAVLTVVLGFLHFAEGGFTGPSAAAHRLYGTLVAVACIAVWLMSAKRPLLYRKVSIVSGMALLALVTMTGHYGGNLTHGSDYLVEYAPQPLRALAGLPERRPAVADLATADPWHDIVQPMLNDRCASCHNDDKRNGDLSVVDFESLMRGGETGRVVSSGNAGLSELYRRVSLPEDDDAFMPAEGKTPLTTEQVEILRWWIDAEAPIDTPAAALNIPGNVEALLRAQLGLDANDSGRASGVAASGEAAHADPAVLDALFAAGFLARQVSQSDPRLVVSIHSVGTDLSEVQLASLREAAGSIVSLDLQSAGLEDAALTNIDGFTALTELRLSNNDLTDAGVAALSGLRSLEVLNLYGNARISDAALDSLAALENLGTVYLWETGVTSAGFERLRELRPQLDVQGAAFVPTSE